MKAASAVMPYGNPGRADQLLAGVRSTCWNTPRHTVGDTSVLFAVARIYLRARGHRDPIVPAGSALAEYTDIRLRDVSQAVAPLSFVEWTAALRPLVAQALAPAQAFVEIPFEMAH